MTIEKTWTFKAVRDKAIAYVLSVYADNINNVVTLPETMKSGTVLAEKECTVSGCYDCGQIKDEEKSRSGGNSQKVHNLQIIYGRNTPSKTNLKFKAVFKTVQTVPSYMLESVSKDTIQSQFESLLNLRRLTEDDFKGKVISVRTVQAIVETMIQFIVSRYQIWTDPIGTEKLTLYNTGDVPYPSIGYNFSIVDYNDTLTQAGMNTMMSSICMSALSSIRVKREEIDTTITSSSSSSSSSSSCSSSCSSSSSSSSCSSSCSCSSAFIAYMNLAR